MAEALSQEPRSSVIIPGFVCPSIAAMALSAGKRIVQVDVDPETLHPILEQIDAALNIVADRDSILLVDHCFGYPFTGLSAIRAKHPDLLIIEDCVRGLGSTIGGQGPGAASDWVLISFYKTIAGSSHGALLLTRSPYVRSVGTLAPFSIRELTANVRPLRFLYEIIKRRRGGDYPAPSRRIGELRWTPVFGSPNDVCLWRFVAEIRHLAERNAQRREALLRLQALVSGVKAITPVRFATGCEPAGHFFSFLVPGAGRRDELLREMHRRGLFLLRTWDVLPSFFVSLEGAAPFGCGGSEYAADHIVHVPMAHYLNPRKQKALADGIRQVLC